MGKSKDLKAFQEMFAALKICVGMSLAAQEGGRSVDGGWFLEQVVKIIEDYGWDVVPEMTLESCDGNYAYVMLDGLYQMKVKILDANTASN